MSGGGGVARKYQPRRLRRLDSDSEEASTPHDASETPILPWFLAAIAGAVLTALSGVVITVAATTIGWFSVPDESYLGVLIFAARIWLLAHGVPAEVGPVTLSVVPLGLTLCIAVVASGVAGFAAQQLLHSRSVSSAELSQRDRRALSLRVAGVFSASYVGSALVVSAVASPAGMAARAMIGAFLVAAVSGLVGAARVIGWELTAELPQWLRVVPKAVAAAQLVMIATSATVLAVALIRHHNRVEALHTGLDPGVLGGILLLGVQLLWLPNFIIWCGSWALGAGLQLGTGSIIAPSQTTTGLLPSIPVLGAVPAPGPGSGSALWWLASGAVAGGVAAWVVVAARRRARFDEVALVGGLSGMLAGLVFCLLGGLSSGDLGGNRLIDLGPRIPELLVMGPTVMGISGLLVGLVAGLTRSEPPAEAPTAEAMPSDDDLDHTEMIFR